MNIHKEFIKHYKPYKKIFFVDIFSTFIMSIIDIILPLVISFMLKTVYVSSDVSYILSATAKVCLILLVLYIIRMICSYIVTYWGHRMGILMEANMRQNIFDKFASFSFSYFDDNETGKMSSRIIYDLHDIGELAHHGQ